MQYLVENASMYKISDTSTVEKILADIKESNYLGLGKGDIKVEAKAKFNDYKWAGKQDREYIEATDITGWTAVAEGDLLDFNANTLGYTLCENVEDTSTEYGVFVPKESLSDSDFINIAVVGKIKGSDKKGIFVIQNCISTDGVKITMKEKDNASVSVKFEGKYTLDGGKPFKVLVPKTTINSEETGV